MSAPGAGEKVDGRSSMGLGVVSATVDELTARWGIVVLRWTAALLWLSNANWKVPPDFGRSGDSCRGLCRYVVDGYEHPVLPGSSWVFEQLAEPNLAAFGWLTIVTECVVAALLISGRFPRSTAVLGMGISFGIFAAVANADGEWYWSYLLMMALHFALLVLAPRARPASVRGLGATVAAYGLVMAVAHAEAGLGGDGNSEWTLFSSSTDIPGDFGRNVFAGSIALGLIAVALGLVVGVLQDSGRWDGDGARVREISGWVLVGAATVLMFTYSDGETVIGLGSKLTFCCMVAGLGLAMTDDSTIHDTTGATHGQS